jgi:hypothetical protein
MTVRYPIAGVNLTENRPKQLQIHRVLLASGAFHARHASHQLYGRLPAASAQGESWARRTDTSCGVTRGRQPAIGRDYEIR